MSLNKLYSIVSFVDAPSGVTSLPHGLNQGGTPVTPDELKVSMALEEGSVTADETNIIFNNDTEGTVSITVLAERWHTIERELGVQDPAVNLSIQPWVTYSA